MFRCLVPEHIAVDSTADSPRGYVSWETLCRCLILLCGWLWSMLSWSLRNWKTSNLAVFRLCSRLGRLCVAWCIRQGAEQWVPLQIHHEVMEEMEGPSVVLTCSGSGFLRAAWQAAVPSSRTLSVGTLSTVYEVEATSCQHACLSWSLRKRQFWPV